MISTGTKFGLLAGVGTIAYFLLFYGLAKEAMLAPVVYYGSLVITIAAMYLAVKQDKASREGAYAYRDGLKPAFQVFVISSALYYIFYYFLNQWDASLVELQRTMMREWLEKVTMKDKLAQALRSLETADFSVTLKTTFFGFARGLIGGFVLAAGLAYFMKDPSNEA